MTAGEVMPSELYHQGRYENILDSHMAPHGAVGIEQSEVRSSEVSPNMISNVIANVICNVTCNANVP